MKLRTAFKLLSIGIVLALASCESYELDVKDVQKYQDAAAPLVPTAGSVQARTEGPSDQPRKLLLIMGVRGFYDASEESKQDVAVKVGKEALTVFGHKVASGSLVLTHEMRDHDAIPADAIVIDMKLDSLRQAMGLNK